MHSNLAKDELDTGLAVKETLVNTDGIYGKNLVQIPPQRDVPLFQKFELEIFK